MNGPCYTDDDLRAPGTISVHHAGDLGDIVYSMQFCSTLGTGKFLDVFLGPDPLFKVRDPMTPGKCAWLAPLLERQPFVRSVTFTATPPPVDYRLSEFRKTWFAPVHAGRKDRQLAAWYFEHFGRGTPPDANASWMVADPTPNSRCPVVINRTARWHGRFPWHEVRGVYAGRMLFVGGKSEYEVWVKEFGGGVEYQEAVDALDMANIISGAQLFIGNQSFAMALALSLGVPVVQESCPGQHDCIFKGRSNAQFTEAGQRVVLPPLAPMKRVMNYPNRQGVIELGPFEGAPGIGDTLMITPLARAIGTKSVMILPPNMERLSFMFRGLCPVKLADGGPTFPFQKGLQSAGLLRMFGLMGVDPVPRIEIAPEALHAAKKLLEGVSNPVAFCPTCARHWAPVRQRPPRFWELIISKLKERYEVLQFGLPDYPLVEGTKRMPFMPVEMLAAIYHLIGVYVGTHTGDYHLMVAVGGRVAVADPDPWLERECWTYNAPARVQYGKLSHPGTVLEAMKRLGI